MAKKYEKCFLFFGSDAHGVASGVVSYENMLKECGEIEYYSKFPDTTSPKIFWTKTYRRALESLRGHKGRCHIVIVDIPLDASDPDTGVRAVEEMAELCDVTFIDHHRISPEKLGELSRSGARVISTTAARSTFYAAPDTVLSEDQFKVMRIGAIADRDMPPPILEEEEMMAYGLDRLVRPPYSPSYAFEVLRKRDWNRLLEEGRKLVAELDKYTGPDNVEVGDEYVYVKSAPANLRFKVLDRATSKYGKPYGVSYVETVHRATGKPVALVTVITNWKSGAVAVGKKLDLDKYREMGCEVFGHESAIVISAPLDRGKEVLKSVLEDPAVHTRGWV